MKTQLSRRHVLRRAAAAAVALPTIIPARVLGARAPSKQVTVGHIGVGGQGSGLLGGFLSVPLGQSLAVCDPFKDRRERAAQRVGQAYAADRETGSYRACQTYTDFRELLARDDIDAVVIATPDHWHVPLALAAIRAGKDVYVEKPLGLTMEQGKVLRETIRTRGAVFQYGTQQRSFSQHCGYACELVRNGYIGEIKGIHVVAPNGATGGSAVAQPVPEGFDYDLWLGPAPVTLYTHDRVIGAGRWHIYDYAIGFIAGWGAHPLDIAHWGYPQIPVEYEGTGRIDTNGLFDTVVDWDVRGRYTSGAEFSLRPGSDLTTFVGTDGWIAVGRGRQTLAAQPASLLDIRIKPDQTRLLQTNNHYRDFLECVLTRRDPVSNIDSAVQSDFMSHLGDICIRTGRRIRWDVERQIILGDEAASRMMTRSLRAPWTL